MKREDVQEIKEDIDRLDNKVDNLGKSLQDQIDGLKNRVDKSIPLWMIAVPIIVVVLVAAVYSGEYAFNPVRTAMIVVVSAVSIIGAVALYLWRRSKFQQ